MKGLKVSLESSYAPDTGAKNGLLKAELKTNPATLTIDTVCALTNMSCAVHKAHCAPFSVTTTLGPESWRPSGEHLCCRRSRRVAGGSAGAFVWQRLDLDLDSQDEIVFLHD